MKKFKDTKVGRVHHVSSYESNYPPKTLINRKAPTEYTSMIRNLYANMKQLITNPDKQLRRIFLECGNDSHVIHVMNSGHIKFFSHPEINKEVIFYSLKYPKLDATAIENIPLCILFKRTLRERLYANYEDFANNTNNTLYGELKNKYRYSSNIKLYELLDRIEVIFKTKKILKVKSNYSINELEEIKTKRIKELASYTLFNSSCRKPKDGEYVVDYKSNQINTPICVNYEEKIKKVRSRRRGSYLDVKHLIIKFTVNTRWYGGYWKKGLALVEDYIVTNIIKPLDKGAYLCEVTKHNKGFKLSTKKAIVFPSTVTYNEETREPKVTGGHVKILTEEIDSNSYITVRRPNKKKTINPSTNPVVTDLNSTEIKENG